MYNAAKMWYNHTVSLYKGDVCAEMKFYRLAAENGTEI